jgi:ABC-type branched-subunit amino acid transport system ATPase component
MHITIKNLGVLTQAEFTLGDLTILCGYNNTGKTYATYALFGFLSFWREQFSIPVRDEEVQQLLDEGAVHIDIRNYAKQAQQIIEQGCQAYGEQLPKVFAAPEERFQETEFQVHLDTEELQPKEEYTQTISSANAKRFSITKSAGSTDLVVTLLVEKERIRIPREILKQFIGMALRDVIFSRYIPKAFISSAERTGAAIFRKELNFTRNRLLEEISQSEDIDPLSLLLKRYQDYPLPVEKNVDFMRDLETTAQKKSFIAQKHPEILDGFADIIGGDYTVTRNDELYYVPQTNKRLQLSVDESSSAVRSLLDIGFYLRHVAEPGDLFMIDEPELNLHPANQRRVARLFAHLINIGMRIFITTHSDYIIKELNTLIMLNRDEPHLQRIAEKEGYKSAELLNANMVKVYIAKKDLILREGNVRRSRCPTLVPADVDSKLGIEARTFDVTINKMNRIQEEIVWGGDV